ncbi:hypothetical protein OUZ56_011698 [Daphnia magna]|uniref:Uncharacterized protein n=1 Tax=Daphnia magna TaxID=35525 RepID=A0ABQ9Z178_9CRUS|nr:hypothetical protein OUZ56_011698 [Daphnia magna]
MADLLTQPKEGMGVGDQSGHWEFSDSPSERWVWVETVRFDDVPTKRHCGLDGTDTGREPRMATGWEFSIN